MPDFGLLFIFICVFALINLCLLALFWPVMPSWTPADEANAEVKPGSTYSKGGRDILSQECFSAMAEANLKSRSHLGLSMIARESKGGEKNKLGRK